MSVDPEKTRRIGDGRISVSQLGFGAAAIASLYSEVPEEQARAAIFQALESGINFFDTAPLYGHGLSEHLLGEALRWAKRDEFVVETKVGRVLDPVPGGVVDGGLFSKTLPFKPRFDYSHDGIMRSLEDSLQRLGLSRVDIVLVHAADASVHGNAGFETVFAQVLDEAYPALDALRRAGVVGAIGVGLNTGAACRRFMEHCDLDLFLLSGRYTLLDQSALDDFLPFCSPDRVSVVIGSPFNSGILADQGPGAPYDYSPAPDDIRAKVARIAQIAQSYGSNLKSLALQFPFSHPAVVSVIPGMRSAAQVNENLACMREAVSADLWNELHAEGLIRTKQRSCN